MRTEFSSSLYFERRLSLLLLVSLVLHLLLLAWLYGPQVKAQVQAKALPLLMATLRLPAAASESLPSALRESVTPAPAALQKTRQTPPRRERLPAAVAEPGAGSPIAPTAAKPEAEPPAPTPAAVPAPEAAAAKAAPRAEPRESETELLAAYRRRLGEILARQQVYPRIAAQRGWEGEVRLRLSVAHQGQLLAVKLERSSGYEVLDQHALAMLAALASLPPLPDALESREVQVVVPVHYKLKKTT